MSGIGYRMKAVNSWSPVILQTALAAHPDQLLPVAGRAVANLWRAYLVTLNSDRHREGGRNFYFQASRAVTYTVVGGVLFVSNNQQGMAQRFYGGPIVAGSNGSGVKWLTLPARQEAYGHRAREFNDLVFVKLRDDLAMLVQRDREAGDTARRSITRRTAETARTVAGQGGLVFYWLVKQVDQEADPTVMPTEDQIRTAATTAMMAVLARAGRT